MNKYVVAVYFYINDELKQEIVSANTKLEAAASYLQPDQEFKSLKALQNYYADAEMCAINVIEITEGTSKWKMPNINLFSMTPAHQKQ